MKKDYGVELHLFYGKEFFDFFNLEWKELINYLIKWKGELPDLPEINFDKEAENTFLEIKKITPQIFFKLFENEELFKEIVLTLFPQKKVLKLLLEYFKSKERETRYKNCYLLLKNKLKETLY